MRPSFLAVFRLMTSSNFLGRSTGRSDGLAPLGVEKVGKGTKLEPLAGAADHQHAGTSQSEKSIPARNKLVPKMSRVPFSLLILP